MVADEKFLTALRALVGALNEIPAPSMIRALIVDIAAALDDPTRVAAFDAMVTRARA